MIPKLPQRESQAQMLMYRPQDFFFLVSRGMVSKNVWRTKKSKLEQHNTYAADEIFLVKEIM